MRLRLFHNAMPHAATDAPHAPAAVVQRQLDAYNARDVDALMNCYAEDADLFEHPDTRLASGRGELRPRFAERFREPDLHAHLRHRIVIGSRVVDHECVTRNFPEGRGTLDLVMIYEVEAGLIQRAWSIAGERRLDPRP